MSWREEARADRLVRAQIDADRAAAAVQARIAARQADAAERRADDRARAETRNQARAARAARRAALLGWAAAHVVDLLFVPVIVVPAVLSWTAMAAYGAALYGPQGWAMPAFSEGAMWAFAAANTITRRRDPDRPTWHLQAGTWVFAAVAAALNFAHGLAAPGHQVTTGVVMALVSVAGVTAHQLVTAGPRRSQADQDTVRLARAAARRVTAVRSAAVRHAVAELDEHGAGRLVYRPGLVTLTSRGHLAPAVVPGLPVPPAEPDGIDWDAELADLAAGTAVTGPAQPPSAGGGGVAVADPPGNTPGPAGLAALIARARAAIASGALPPRPSQRALRDLLGIRMARAGQVQRALSNNWRTP